MNIATIQLTIDGLGLILYSPHAVTHINEGEDYLEKHFWDPDKVIQHARNGTIVGICTGSPGTYILHFHDGKPSNTDTFSLRIEVRESILYTRDLYDLMNWTAACPEGQKVTLENGLHSITGLTNIPDSGIYGDNQEIFFYFEKVASMPEIELDDIPMLCTD